MILGMPISWLIVEALSLVLFFIVLVHASRQEDATRRLLEFFGFVIAAALFENVGVKTAHAYSYDLRRIMMIGAVPLEILLLEASIWYAAFNLVGRLNLPRWGWPFVVGLFGSVQDLTIDPPAVFDRHALTDPAQIAQWNRLYPGSMGDGIFSGQWNWTDPGYSGLPFGIPFFNFSGWLYLMFYFTAFVLLGRWLTQRVAHAAVSYAYPFVAAVMVVLCLGSPVNEFLLFGVPLAQRGDRSAEIVMLCINYAIPLGLLVLYRKRFLGVDLRRDGVIVFGIPVVLHVFDVVYAFSLGLRIAYLPVVVVTLLHVGYLSWLALRPMPTTAPSST